ncbi:BTB/POZ domain-containing protein-like [Dorcoceras hygrometricum]|uniref:BTB/POZ domain-containing protein-like n=1 Tax=Dorcoceras hygrometricum TaxID=472368 RepID=A0A2Z7CFZ3_9LAMI|nr:BTB/POZ domain-containing protein-like [Dorcoceras hygrometricum]
MANQIKRSNVSSLTYENFPGGHPSQYCSHPCTLTLPLPPALSPAEIVLPVKIWHHIFSDQQLDVRELPRRLHKGYVFAHLTSFKQTFKNNIQTKRLSKRSPTLPLSLSLELSTVDNRRR